MHAATATRHDMPQAIHTFLNVATVLEVIDLAEIWALSQAHGSDWTAMLDTIIGYAYANRNVNPKPHEILCGMVDAWHAAQIAPAPVSRPALRIVR